MAGAGTLDQPGQGFAGLRQRGARRGMASLCIGGGEATALAVEML